MRWAIFANPRRGRSMPQSGGLDEVVDFMLNLTTLNRPTAPRAAGRCVGSAGTRGAATRMAFVRRRVCSHG